MLNKREKSLLRRRRDALKDQLREGGLTPAKAEDITRRLKTVRKWLEGPAAEGVEEKRVLSRAEFRQILRDVYGVDSADPQSAIQLETRKDVDRFWPWIATANIQISAPADVREYLRAKIRNLRPEQMKELLENRIQRQHEEQRQAQEHRGPGDDATVPDGTGVPGEAAGQ